MRLGVLDRNRRAADLRLLPQLRHPPGGRDARIMLLAQSVDRMGSGTWAASSVLYFTFVAGLDSRRLGLLLGIAGAAGVAASPIAGRLAGRFSVRSLLIACHLLRLTTLSLLLVCTGFSALLPVVTVTYLGDRAAKTLEMLFATQVAGARRTTYRALSRTTANAGYALGAGLAAIGLAMGTSTAYRILIGADALSFAVAAAMVWRIRQAHPDADRPTGHPSKQPDVRPARRSPWRDRGYLLFVLLDTPLSLDDSILNIGLPLWLVHRTAAPRAFIPALLVMNTLVVVVAQLRVSARVRRASQAAAAVAVGGLTLLFCCVVITIAPVGGMWAASLAMLAAALLVTIAEVLRSVSSWELAVCLAPSSARASYLGVAGMAQSVQKSIGPLLLTGAVMVAGTVGWIALGAALAGLSVVQWRFCLRRLNAAQPVPTVPVPALPPPP